MRREAVLPPVVASWGEKGMGREKEVFGTADPAGENWRREVQLCGRPKVKGCPTAEAIYFVY